MKKMPSRKSKRISIVKSMLQSSKKPYEDLFRSIEITNSRLNKLAKRKELGHYASKKLLRNIRISPVASYDKKSKTIKIAKSSKLNANQARLLNKELKSFLNSKTSNAKNIKRIRQETMQKVKDKLGRITNQDISKSDVEEFYTLTNDKDYKYFVDFIDPSEFYALVSEAKSRDMSEDEFIELLKQYMTISDESALNKATELYDKYVKNEIMEIL